MLIEFLFLKQKTAYDRRIRDWNSDVCASDLPLTADRPKCLIEFSGRTLIDWQLDSLIANGIDDIAVVVGFRDDQVADALARRGENRARITTIFNPFYKVADNLGSVWLARQQDRKSTRLNSSH